MNILTCNSTKGTSDLLTRYEAVKRRVISKRSIKKICQYYHVSRVSLWRWICLFDGTEESLYFKSHRPLNPHPNTTDITIQDKIINVHRRNPRKSTFEIWLDLITKYNITISYMTVLRVLKRNLCYTKYKTNKKKVHNQHYDTPTEVGIKWQIDVKYVPTECKSSNLEGRYYQYTIIDECSRKRALYFTNDHSMYETVNALKYAFALFGYKPKEIQTDHGFEFTDHAQRKSITEKQNYLEKFCENNNIIHHLIRPRTPEHNGKVERSHRIDQEKFYRYLKFYNLTDLRCQGEKRNKIYNKMPRFVLRFKSPNEIELESLRQIYVQYGEIRCLKCFTSIVS